MDELKCRCCGRTAQLWSDGHGNYTVDETGEWFPTKEEAIAAWKRYTTPKENNNG